MERFIEIGLSGWIIFVIAALIGGGITYRHITRWRTRQSNITAGGDVAGGDILKGRNGENTEVSSSKKINSVQKNIRARGDVAGGSIVRNDK